MTSVALIWLFSTVYHQSNLKLFEWTEENSIVPFQVVPKVACSKGCMITLAASYDFFPLWDLECIHILAGQVDVMLHWLHLFDFSPLCVIKCILKLPACMDAKSQWLYLFDFSPKCVFKCLLKSPAWEDAKLYWLHFFDFSSLCVFKCIRKLPAWVILSGSPTDLLFFKSRWDPV